MRAGRQRAFAALYYAARGLESAAAGLYHAAAGLMTHADLHAAITEEWRRFPSSEEPSDASLFDWEKAFYARFLERTDKILLVGCGTGRDLIALLQCGHRVDGVDLVREAVVRARQRLAEHKFEGSVWVGDIETIELVERYDVFVFSWFCYAYIPESARRVRILKRLAEHLAPEGRILISYVPTDKARRAIRVARLVARLTRSDWRPELGDSVAATGDSMSSVSFQHFFRTGDADAEAAAAGLCVLAQVPSDQVITMALAKPSLG